MFFSMKLLVDGLEVRYMGGYRVSGREREPEPLPRLSQRGYW